MQVVDQGLLITKEGMDQSITSGVYVIVLRLYQWKTKTIIFQQMQKRKSS